MIAIGSAIRKAIAFATRLVNEPSRGESGWYVRTGEADALAAGSRYLEGVDVDSALSEHFDAAIQSVLEVNETSTATGGDRVNELHRVYRDKINGAEPVFIPRVFISPYGSVALEEEPRGTDTYRVVRCGPDIQSLTMCGDHPRAQVAMPGELLHRLQFREMVPRAY